MRIFVTGGTGIVGRAVVPVLRARGHDVLVLTRSSLRRSDGYCQGDLADAAGLANELRRFAPEAALHLAWEGLPDYSLQQTRRNLDHSINFFVGAAEAGCKTIMSTGSCWEYEARTGMLTEDAALSGVQPFHAAKNALRFLGEAVATTYAAKFYWMRLFFVYGPGQRPQSLVPQVVASMQEGRSPQLRAPNNRHDFVYVADVAQALVKVLEQRPPRTVYNVGSGQPTTVTDVIAAVRDLIGGPPADQLEPGHADQDFWADITRIERDTGWRPTFDLHAGLRATLSSMA